MKREDTIEAVRQTKLITIVRGVKAELLLPLAEALWAGGVRLLEITFDQKHPETNAKTAAAIRALRDATRGRMTIGAGTVITPAQYELAKAAGAAFLISPHTDTALIRATVEDGMVSIPGAMTPTEIVTAHAAGADFVKLFPAGTLGARYLADVAAPLSHIPLLAVGGITPENAGAFLKAGAVGVGVGSYLADRRLAEDGDFAAITARCREFCV